MAKRGGSNGESVAILREIWNEMKTLNGRIEKTNQRLDKTIDRLDKTVEGVDALRHEMHAGFSRLEGRIENLLTGEHGRAHGEIRDRLARIEARLGLPPRAAEP